MAKYPAFQKCSIPWRITSSRELKILENRCLALSELLQEREGDWKKPALQKDKVRLLRSIWLKNMQVEEKQKELLRQKNHLSFQRWVSKQTRLEIGDLRQVHAKTLGASRSLSPFRTEKVSILTRGGRILHRYPEASLLPSLLVDLQNWDEERQAKPSLTAATTLHLLILCIHPFMDGNGRVARGYEYVRMKQAGMVLHPGWEPELMVHWNAGGYSKVIQACRRNGAANEFTRFILNSYLSAGNGLIL